MGLSGLLIARILKLPIDCTYQDTMPAYVRYFTKDEGVQHIVRRYFAWFYNQMGRIYTTSSKVERKLAQEGIRSEKITIKKPWEDAGNVRNLKVDSFFKCRFHFPINWKECDHGSSVKAAI
jgi:hypothetical protein